MIFTELRVSPWQIIVGSLVLLAAVMMPDSAADAYPRVHKTEALLYKAVNISFRPCANIYSVPWLQ